jgi:hypothetical protein
MEKHKKIHEMIDKFLKDRKMCERGGYPPVTEKEITALYRLFDAIIQAKFQNDCDGDAPVNVRFVNRTKEHMPCFSPVPHRDDDEVSRRRILEITSFNLSVAFGAWDTANRILQYHWQDEERKAKEQK